MTHFLRLLYTRRLFYACVHVGCILKLLDAEGSLLVQFHSACGMYSGLVAELLLCAALISGSWACGGTPVALNCGTLQQRLEAHGSTSSKSISPYFINISSFRDESTFTYTPGRSYEGKSVIIIMIMIII